MTLTCEPVAATVGGAAWAAGLSIGAYLLFARLLDLPLPAGVMAGWR